MKNILLIVIDGLGDRPNAIFNGLTALEYAYTPNMDRLAGMGTNGLMYPVDIGVVAGSDTSHLSILGYDPSLVYTGRGPFEAMGLGISVKPGDIAFRANFATVDPSGTVTDRRAGRSSMETGKLAREISMNIDGIDFLVKEGVEHRAALVMRGKDLSPDVSDSDPHSAGARVKRIEAKSESGKFTAGVLNKYLDTARKILRESPSNSKRKQHGLPEANELLIRGAGIVPELQDFSSKFGLKAACVAGVPIITGIASLAGMEIHKNERMTGTVNSDFDAKISTALDLLGKYDFVLVNIKGPDVAGHDRNPVLKKEVIERIDKAFERLIPAGSGNVICITGDHSTPCSVGEHSGDPVPILLYTEGCRRDGVNAFNEVASAGGSLRIKSGEVMRYLMQMSDRSEKYGA